MTTKDDANAGAYHQTKQTTYQTSCARILREKQKKRTIPRSKSNPQQTKIRSKTKRKDTIRKTKVTVHTKIHF